MPGIQRTNGAGRGGAERVDILQHDRELAESLGRPGNGAGSLHASTIRLERGPWRPEEREPSSSHLGFLVLEGVLGRKVVLPQRGRSLELLGTGDVFRPWQEDSPSFSRVDWVVLEPSTLAELDESVAKDVRRLPELLEALTDRALRRTRRLAVSAAIANTVGVEDRLFLLLWQLAEIWGRMDRRGAVLPVRLSHQTLADLVGARRPTVTLALRSLSERGALERGEGGEWVLTGDPP